jgi:hypothetical protein
MMQPMPRVPPFDRPATYDIHWLQRGEIHHCLFVVIKRGIMTAW